MDCFIKGHRFGKTNVETNTGLLYTHNKTVYKMIKAVYIHLICYDMLEISVAEAQHSVSKTKSTIMGHTTDDIGLFQEKGSKGPRPTQEPEKHVSIN